MTTMRLSLIILALVLLVLFSWLDWGVEDYATQDCARDMPPLVPNFWRGIRVFDLGSPYYTGYNPDGRGHFTVVRVTNDFLYAADAAWDPKNPGHDIRFPAGWHVKMPLH